MTDRTYTLTTDERNLFVASLFDFQRQDAAKHIAGAEREIGRWMGYMDVLEDDCGAWALLLLDWITEGRINTRNIKMPPLAFRTWEDMTAFLRKGFEALAAEDMFEAEQWYAERPEGFIDYHGDKAVVDGKVVHPWGSIHADALALLAILTPYTVWSVYNACMKRGEDSLRENLLGYAGGNGGEEVAQSVHNKFDAEMKRLQARLAK